MAALRCLHRPLSEFASIALTAIQMNLHFSFVLKAARQIGGNWLLSRLSLARSIGAHSVKQLSDETPQKFQ